MSEYYFVTTLLPQLKIGQTPELTGGALAFTLGQNLSRRDLHKITILRRLTDMENIRRFWQGSPLEPGGTLDEKTIEEYLLRREGFPRYVYDYLKQYEETRDRISHFPELLRSYLEREIKENRGFLRKWFQFELDSRLVFITLRSKLLGRTLATQNESRTAENDSPDGFFDHGIDFINELFEQEDIALIHPPELYYPLKAIFESNLKNPLALHRALAQWKFDLIEEMAGSNPFHMNRILAYMLQLELAEKWLRLDKKKGLQFVEKVGIA